MKACPIVVRQRNGLQILAFEHPLAGLQLVKGSVETGESCADAALRELYEESGIMASAVLADLGIWKSGHQKQDWSFHLCEVPTELPETWVHHADDDGGHEFRFFWYPLQTSTSGEWHEVFRDALAWLAARADSLLAYAEVALVAAGDT